MGNLDFGHRCPILIDEKCAPISNTTFVDVVDSEHEEMTLTRAEVMRSRCNETRRQSQSVAAMTSAIAVPARER
jgi:hypothetical protein